MCFTDNKHTSTRFHCNRSSLHLNYYGTKIFLYELVKLNWQIHIVAMCTLSKNPFRVRNKNIGKR